MNQKDLNLQRYLKEIGRVDLLTIEEEIELAARIKKGDAEARDHMIRANLRLVVKIAAGYQNYGLSLADLVAEGNIGLMKAVERYDPAKGGKLSTYAAWWIKQSVKRALANQARTIRMPVHAVDTVSKMRWTTHRLSEKLGRAPTDHELATELDIDMKKLQHLREISMPPVSLESTPTDDPEGRSVGERVEDANAIRPDESLSDQDMSSQLDSLLSVLDRRERAIINQRFGLTGRRPKTLEQVGAKFGVTRERIRQLQNRALEKMREALADMENPETVALKQLVSSVREREPEEGWWESNNSMSSAA
jgi:RNA polymerase primary sigma factor